MQKNELRNITEKIVEKERLPINGGIELLSACNFKCVHCYNSQEPRQIMNMKMAFRIIDELEAMGTMHIYLTGGEVLLHPDFKKIYKYIRKKGIMVSVLTNASLIDEQFIELFKRYTPYVLDISLYGATNLTYTKVTGQDDGFDRVYQNLKLLKNSNIEFSLKTIALKENISELNDMKIIANEFGKQLKIYTDIRPLNNGNKKSQEHRISNEEIVKIEEAEGRWKLKKQDDSVRTQQRKQRKKDGFLYFCEMGMYNFFITYEGKMFGCVKERLHGYDLNKYSVDEAFDLIYQNLVQKKSDDVCECQKCKFLSYCDYCPAQFELDTGSVINPPRYICDLAKLRYRTFEK